MIEYAIEIPVYDERQRMIRALANSGHPVRVEERDGKYSWSPKHHWLVFSGGHTKEVCDA